MHDMHVPWHQWHRAGSIRRQATRFVMHILSCRCPDYADFHVNIHQFVTSSNSTTYTDQNLPNGFHTDSTFSQDLTESVMYMKDMIFTQRVHN
jgi:hypothetical protein